MKSSYRIKYLLGAPIIVVIGLAGAFWVPRAVAFGNQASHWAYELKHSAEPVTMDISFVPAYVDGRKIGTLRRVVVQRNRPGAVDSLNVVVELSHPQDAARLGQCRMVLTDMDDFDLGDVKHMVRCSSDTTGLVPFGQVTFGAVSAPLYVEGNDFSCAETSPQELAACVHRETERIRVEVQQEIQREVQQNIRRMRDRVRVQVRSH